MFLGVHYIVLIPGTSAFLGVRLSQKVVHKAYITVCIIAELNFAHYSLCFGCTLFCTYPRFYGTQASAFWVYVYPKRLIMKQTIIACAYAEFNFAHYFLCFGCTFYCTYPRFYGTEASAFGCTFVLFLIPDSCF